MDNVCVCDMSAHTSLHCRYYWSLDSLNWRISAREKMRNQSHKFEDGIASRSGYGKSGSMQMDFLAPGSVGMIWFVCPFEKRGCLLN